MNNTKIANILGKNSTVLESLSFGVENIALNLTEEQESQVVEKVIAIDKAVGDLSKFLATRGGTVELPEDIVQKEVEYNKNAYTELSK